MKKLLHIGCGNEGRGATPREWQGATWSHIRIDADRTVEPDFVASILRIPVAHCNADAIYTCHMLEHLWPHDIPQALGECFRVLKPGCLCLMIVPNIAKAAEHIARDRPYDVVYTAPGGLPVAAIDLVYGHRATLKGKEAYAGHHTGFTPSSAKLAFEQAGFRTNIEAESFSLVIRATRPA